jgi:hypothetical protein
MVRGLLMEYRLVGPGVYKAAGGNYFFDTATEQKVCGIRGDP